MLDDTPTTTRNPLLLLRLSGLLLLRLADRQFVGLLFHEPPRNTRLAPYSFRPRHVYRVFSPGSGGPWAARAAARLRQPPIMRPISSTALP